MISIISAVGENSVIGIKNGLPWKLSGDLKYFSKITTGKTVVMGKNTYESIISMIGKPLPNRRNIVVVFQKDPRIQDIQLTSVQEVVDLAKKEDIFIIGGASIYREMMPYAEKLYITRVHAKPDGDVTFPDIDPKIWKLISSDPQKKGEKDEFDYTFEVYERQS